MVAPEDIDKTKLKEYGLVALAVVVYCLVAQYRWFSQLRWELDTFSQLQCLLLLPIGFLAGFSLFREAFDLPLATAGALLVLHYSWPVESFGYGVAWGGPLLAAIGFLLVEKKPALLIAGCLMLTVFLSPPVLLAEVLLLACWFIGEAYGEFTRPQLVQPTLNLKRILRPRRWGILLASSIISVSILGWFVLSSPGLKLVGNLAGPNKTPNPLKLWADWSSQYLSLGDVPAWSILLVLGATLLSGAYIHRMRSLIWLLLGLAVTGLLVPMVGPYLPLYWDAYANDGFFWELLAPLSLVLITGAGTVLVPKKWMAIPMVLLLMGWAYAYSTHSGNWQGIG